MIDRVCNVFTTAGSSDRGRTNSAVTGHLSIYLSKEGLLRLFLLRGGISNLSPKKVQQHQKKKKEENPTTNETDPERFHTTRDDN